MTEPSDANQPENPTGAPGGYPPQNYPPQNYPQPGYPPQQGYPAQPGGYPGGYPPPPQPYSGYPVPAPAPKNGLGIAALICGLISLPAAFTIFGGFFLGLLAVILGIVGYRRVKKGAATNGGIAIGGVVFGVLGIVVSAVLIAVGVSMFKEYGGTDLVDCLSNAGSDQAAQQKCQNDFTNNLENQLSITVTPTP
jgi:hypothetical protein